MISLKIAQKNLFINFNYHYLFTFILQFISINPFIVSFQEAEYLKFILFEIDLFQGYQNPKRINLIYIILKNMVHFSDENTLLKKNFIEIFEVWFKESILMGIPFDEEKELFVVQMIDSSFRSSQFKIKKTLFFNLNLFLSI